MPDQNGPDRKRRCFSLPSHVGRALQTFSALSGSFSPRPVCGLPFILFPSAPLTAAAQGVPQTISRPTASALGSCRAVLRWAWTHSPARGGDNSAVPAGGRPGDGPPTGDAPPGEEIAAVCLTPKNRVSPCPSRVSDPATKVPAAPVAAAFLHAPVRPQTAPCIFRRRPLFPLAMRAFSARLDKIAGQDFPQPRHKILLPRPRFLSGAFLDAATAAAIPHRQIRCTIGTSHRQKSCIFQFSAAKLTNTAAAGRWL